MRIPGLIALLLLHKISEAGLAEKYKVEVSPVELQPWRMRDFTLLDPSGVLWRIAENVK